MKNNKTKLTEQQVLVMLKARTPHVQLGSNPAPAQARIYSMLNEHVNLLLADAQNWHPLPPRYGEVHGIPSLRGKLLCANGNLAILIRGDEYCLIHLSSFVEDKEQTRAHSDKPKASRATRKWNAEDIIDLYGI